MRTVLIASNRSYDLLLMGRAITGCFRSCFRYRDRGEFILEAENMTCMAVYR